MVRTRRLRVLLNPRWMVWLSGRPDSGQKSQEREKEEEAPSERCFLSGQCHVESRHPRGAFVFSDGCLSACLYDSLLRGQVLSAVVHGIQTRRLP